MSRLFGCHVSVSGGLENGIINGEKLGVNTIQLHPSPPQRWNSSEFKEGSEDKFIELRRASAISQVFFHAIYLINLATPDSKNFHLSKVSLVNYLNLATRVEGNGVIVHVGSLKDQEHEDEGLARAADGINWVMEHAKNGARLLLEVAAGSGKVIGSRVEQLALIYDKIDNKDRVGFALDSQHLWASGYDLREHLETVVTLIESNFGLDKVWAIHLNDSKTECGSKKDRHENLGEGLLGIKALTRFVNHVKLRHIPFILETPALKDMTSAAAEVNRLREILK